MKKLFPLLSLALLPVLACDTGDGEGGVEFTTWGEELIEREIPSEMFADGWRIQYSKFLIHIGSVRIADGDNSVVAETSASTIYDHKQPGLKTITEFTAIEAKNYPRVSYRVLPVTGDVGIDGATADDRTFMKANGYSVYVEGTASKAAVTKTFKWGFTTATLYDHCKGEVSGKELDGVLVTNNGIDSVEITVHGDHFFYDDLQSPDAKRRFDAIASADTNTDGEVTLAELSALKLAAIPAEQGGYGVGSASGINDLGAFVAALSRTVGHFRGEGECVSSAL